MGMAWGLGHELCLSTLNREKLSTKGFKTLFIGTFLSSWLGSKLFFLFASSGNNFAIHSKSVSFWLGGGFVFFGGLLLGSLFIFFYCFLLKKFNPYSLYCILPAVCFSHALGRVGCYFSGCCFGKICNLSWGIFKRNGGSHPVQIYESFFLILLGIYLILKIFNDNKRNIQEKFYKYSTVYLISYSIFRFFIEFLRGDRLRGLYWGFSTSQYVSFFIFISLLYILFKKNRFLLRQ